MKLENKNLLYSLLLAAVLVIFLVGYFMFMLPSLYLEHMDEQNLDGVVEQHRAYRRQKSYEGVALQNPSACFTVELPTEGENLIFTNAYVSARVQIEDAMTQELLSEIKVFFQNRDASLNGELRKKLEDYMEGLLDRVKEPGFPVSVEILYQRNQEGDYENEEISIHRIADDLLVVEAKVRDAQNQYTTYLAMTASEDALILSVLPSISTRMGEMRAVVGGSIPMIIAVIVLLVLLFSYFYSNGIMKPLFYKLQVANEELDEKNRLLKEDNKRQEVFLRASSHQLKTPISAALLLVDGMISKIGKFRDYERYLPKVKEQLLTMRKMVEDILYLNHSKEHMQKEPVDVTALLTSVIAAYEVSCSERGLTITSDVESSCIAQSDADMLRKMIDNLVSNAVCYAQPHSRIHMRLSEHALEIENAGHIPDELEEHIFEPFVSTNTTNKSHGLGLYIVSFYAKLLDMSVSVRNVGNQVVTCLKF